LLVVGCKAVVAPTLLHLVVILLNEGELLSQLLDVFLLD